MMQNILIRMSFVKNASFLENSSQEKLKNNERKGMGCGNDESKTIKNFQVILHFLRIIYITKLEKICFNRVEQKENKEEEAVYGI